VIAFYNDKEDKKNAKTSRL